ncbi:patatin-like phospholipase family protein [Mycolicibacterium sphagni]|uniref:patatin-like phospholipase family protein n=1 Tax=Mycolicibacterium sphagni TaxID=1786 RepID=UPI001A9C6C53|nr:patatin-like phospholipase family protein [Mycolicibacterium sphagni]MCV7179589.1 patatin-like phospholipase family protein [Mycolicibacterium sphagni]
MTTKRALILAGGGLAGIGWETGILRGIADEAPDTAQALVNSDVLVGTSAGSTVAAQISSPLSLEQLFERQTGDISTEINPDIDVDAVVALFLEAGQQPGDLIDKLQRIGAIALTTPTVDESARRKVIEARLPAHTWPAQDLRITAIDTATGELAVFDSSSGVELVDAVAASCAVPGTWPPVTIGGRRYMDGGVSSSVHTAVAADCATAVVLVPASESTPSPFSSGTAAEIAAFGARTFAVFADDASLAAFGPNLLDPRCRVPSALAGREQGRRVAAAVTEFLA